MKIIPIKQWSASKLKTFSQCKLRAQLQYGQKIPEPERPLPPGKTEHANDRGSRIHLDAENFVQGVKGSVITSELEKFRPELESLRQLYADGKVSVEGDWAYAKDWTPVGWRDADAWLRAKLDVIVHLSEQEAVIIDYKSGSKFGNEVGHMQQMQIYQLISFLRFPKLEHITVELWYVDQKDEAITQASFTRAQGMKLKHSIERQAHALTDCMVFPASPNIFSCKYCPYGPRGTGHCERGV